MVSVGTRERRKREVIERECLFLDTALELICEDGLLNLQMSKIAEKAEYAVGTLYLHFASKEDLLLALVIRAFRDYIELVRRVASWDALPRHRMLGLAVAEWEFVQRHPNYFRIAQYSMCEVAWQAASAERRETFLATNDPLSEIVTEIVTQARARGELPEDGQTAEEMGMGLWALCFGYHNLSHAAGILEDFSIRQPYPLMCRQVQAMLDGYGWQPLSDPRDPGATDRLVQHIRDELFGDAADAN